MDPREFHQVASRLASGTRPGELRSAISRAYYAAYNVSVQILKEMGFKIPESSAGHGEVQNRLGNSGDGEIEVVASQLTDLHSRRIQADYKMARRDVERQGTAQGIVEQAGRMIHLLNGCRSEPKRTQVVNAIKEWERRVYGGGGR